ncbi:single-stranded DNA-binding protein [Candidatus Saccharibacteria bacterium]|nr:MAG: single-stranded DNA-binding protein [Candidatus Saccharibacteria bacterium]
MGEIIQNQETTPAELIRAAVAGGADLTKLQALLDLQIQYEANEARKAYHKAMAEFKLNPPVITKDKQNKQYNSMYTTLGNLVNTVNPELSKHGLSSSWDIKQNGVVSVTCKITHRLGHSESASASAPIDTSGAKNPIQQIKSTITYLKAVTFESVTGLASTDANYDDDGHASGVVCINEKQLHQIRDLLIAKERSEAKLCEMFKIEKLEDLPDSKFISALAAINVPKAKEAKR